MSYRGADISIEKVLNGAHGDFLNYCAEIGKTNAKELKIKDFSAYRKKYSSTKAEVAELREILAAKNFKKENPNEQLLQSYFNIEDLEPYENIYVGDLNFSIRVLNCLVNNGVKTVADLLRHSRVDVANFRNLGRVSMRNIISVLKNFIFAPGIEGREVTLSEVVQSELSDTEKIVSIADKIHNTVFTGENGERDFKIILDRTGGNTLKQVGNNWGLTRERVRQIETRVTNRAILSCQPGINNMILLIHDVGGGKDSIGVDDFANFVDADMAKILWFFVKKIHFDNADYHYDDEVDKLIFDAAALEPDIDIEAFRKLLGADVVDVDVFVKAVEEFAVANDYTVEFVRTWLEDFYTIHGKIALFGTRITLDYESSYILKRFFPDGYKVADSEYTARFNRILKEFFGMKAPFTQRNIDSKVSRVGLLCGRGKYIHPDFVHIPPETMELIEEFIKDSRRDALLFKEIFEALKDKFVGTQITDHYILQGVIKNAGLPYVTKKDYLMKTASASLDAEFKEFVKQHSEVTVKDIKKEFISFANHNIAMLLARCPEIIPIGVGRFIHSARLNVNDGDYAAIEKFLRQKCSSNPMSARKLFGFFKPEFPEFLARNNIVDHEKLFGILKYMFKGKFGFSRQYVSTDDLKRVTKREILMKRLASTDAVYIDEFFRICDEYGINYVSRSFMIHVLRPDFIRVDAVKLCRPASIGLTAEVSAEVCNRLREAIARNGGWQSAKTFKDNLPQLSVPWTGFLIESVVALAGEHFNVLKSVTTHPNFATTIFVDDRFKDDDFSSFLMKILIAVNNESPFKSQEEILQWAREQGFCNMHLPKFLFDTNCLDRDGGIYIPSAKR